MVEMGAAKINLIMGFLLASKKSHSDRTLSYGKLVRLLHGSGAPFWSWCCQLATEIHSGSDRQLLPTPRRAAGCGISIDVVPPFFRADLCCGTTA